MEDNLEVYIQSKITKDRVKLAIQKLVKEEQAVKKDITEHINPLVKELGQQIVDELLAEGGGLLAQIIRKEALKYLPLILSEL
jgi:riboflavin biosynthesis pyrimidine reductase